MNIWSAIRKVSINELGKLFLIGLKNPMYIYPTYSATKQTLRLCETHFPQSHHDNGIENAFRHALWNELLCMRVYTSNKNKEQAIRWAKKITDLHEELAPNDLLDKKMDLHNNAIGRESFQKNPDKNTDRVVLFLQEKMQTAIPISEIKDLILVKHELVYIKDLKSTLKTSSL